MGRRPNAFGALATGVGVSAVAPAAAVCLGNSSPGPA
jgi:hypothetical protein